MATRAQQIEILAAGVLYDGAVIATPYAAFFATGTSTPKNAYADIDKAVAITKKALDSQGRAVVYGDGIYDIKIYSGDPDAGGVLKFTVPGYKVTAVTGNARTITTNTTGSVDDVFVLVDTASQNITYDMPSAVEMNGRFLTLKKKVAANVFTYRCSGASAGQTIDNAASATLSAANATVQVYSDGTNWYGAQIVGAASSLNGYTSNTGTTASTIPVRDGSGKLPGDILGNAATATSATAATSATKHNGLNVVVVEIGGWDMDADATSVVLHGIDGTKVVSSSVLVRDDNIAATQPLVNGGTYTVEATTVSMSRITSGIYDTTLFNDDGINRGFITLFYTD